MPKYLMGVDIGTSGTKSIIADENGRVIASRTEEYPLYTPSLLNLVKTSETHVRGLDPNQ